MLLNFDCKLKLKFFIMQVFEQFLKKKNQLQTSTVIMLFLILILKIITYF